MLRATLLLALMATALTSAFSQSFENVKVTPNASGIAITYDLKGNGDETFMVAVFASHDNFSVPLKLVSGDVGKGVKPGVGKTISWNSI